MSTESKQTYILRCVELEGRTLTQVMENQENVLFHGELQRGDGVTDEGALPLSPEVAPRNSDNNEEGEYWEVEFDPNAPRLMVDLELESDEEKEQRAHAAACDAAREQLPEEVQDALRHRVCRSVAHDATNAHEMRCKMSREIIARDYAQLVEAARRALDAKKPDDSR